MLNIYYCLYELLARNALNSKQTHAVRRGALLKVQYEDGSMGYADCHPWTELGDLALEEQLNLLRKRELTPLTQRSMYFAEMDARARIHKRSVFADLAFPPSHWLVANLQKADPAEISKAIADGFKYFKIKFGGSAEEFSQLKKLGSLFSDAKLKIRLDFNQRLTVEDFERILPELEFLRGQMDFFEDPCPYNEKSWSQLQKQHGIRLACDFQSQHAIGKSEASAVLVIKPAVQDEAIFLAAKNKQQKLVITTYLDHPLGQLAAAYVAALCAFKNPNEISICGLMSHYAYQPNAFSAQLTTKGPILIPPQGTGFGFDDLLQQQTWKILE